MGAICGKSEGESKAKGQSAEKPVKSKYQMKLGLVGTSSCGKTTVAKQMRILHGGGFTDQEKATFKTVLVSNTLVTFKELIRYAQKKNIQLEIESEDIAQSVSALDHFNTVLTPELVQQIQTLWKDKAIQEVYGHRNEFYIPPNTEYCLSRLESLLDPNLEPTTEDILRARLRSAGVTDNAFQIGKFTWTLVDPGGQRSERRKWPQFFNGVVGMIYVAGLDEWDCLLVDEPDKTRLVESLEVWDGMVNDPVFQTVPWILFLNKKDLFAEKLKTVELSKTFPEYKGGNDYDKGIEFMQQLYLSKVKGRPTEDVFTHVTCALDTEQIKVVFQSVTDYVFKQSAKQAGVF